MEYASEFEKLDTAVSLFLLALSRRQHLEHGDKPGTTEAVLNLWLVALVQTCNILLHHFGSPQLGLTDERHQDAKKTSAYHRCLKAARQTTDTMKLAAQTSPELLVNPFLVTIHFLCGRFLSIAWHEDRKELDRDGIDFVLLLVGIMAERWPSLAKKFRKGIVRDLGKTDEETRQMKMGTGCYLDVGCA